MNESTLALERQTLGWAMLQERHRENIVDQLEPSDFTREIHQKVFARIAEEHAAGNPVDLVSISALFPGHAAELSEMTSEATNNGLEPHIAQLRNTAMLRRFKGALQETLEELKTPRADASEIIAEHETRLTEITQRVQADYLNSREVALRTAEAYEERKAGSAYLRSGFSRLDSLCGGMRPGQMIVLGARPSIGKTALSVSMLTHVTRSTSAAGATFEMDAVEYGERWAAADGMVPLQSIRNATLPDRDIKHFTETLDTLSRRKLFVLDDPNATMAHLRSTFRRLRRTEGIELVVVDYIGLIRSVNKSQARYDFIGECSRALKALARELGVPVLVLTQLNRLAEGQRPSLAHIRESGSLEQDADQVWFLHRDRSVPAAAAQVDTELIVAKNRSGRTGVIPLVFRTATATFYEKAFGDQYEQRGEESEPEPVPKAEAAPVETAEQEPATETVTDSQPQTEAEPDAEPTTDEPGESEQGESQGEHEEIEIF